MSITLTNVTYTYMKDTPYERNALQGIQLTIEKGEFLGVIGHTGSGKSTLMQHLNGLLKPVDGKVCIDGVDIHSGKNDAKAARRKVGMVFQYPEHQLFEETVYADIAFGPRNLGLAENEVDKRVRQAMEFVGLDAGSFAERSPFQLSGGQMRRVAIAGVIALQPEYLILDEPSAGLDPRGRDEIFGEILNLYRETGIAVVLVSHNMEEVARMSSRIVVLNGGKICLDGSPQDIFKHSVKELREAGVDVPRANILLQKLTEHGLPVHPDSMTVEEIADDIADWWRRDKRC